MSCEKEPVGAVMSYWLMGDGDEESRTEFTEGTEVRGTGISYRKVEKGRKVRGDSSFSQEGKDQVAVSMEGEDPESSAGCEHPETSSGLERLKG